MKPYLVLLPIFLLALFQGAFLPLNLVFLVVLVWSAFAPPKQIFPFAFVAGLFLDLAKGTPLGLSSLLLLVASGLLLLYRRKFDPLQPFFLPVFVFLANLGYSLVRGYFDWLGSLVLAILALGIVRVLKYFGGEAKGVIKLKV